MKKIVTRASDSNRRLSRLLIGSVFVISTIVALTTASQAFVLVSPDEVANERAKGEPPLTRGVDIGSRGGPEIVLVSPRSLQNIPSPLDIELRFLPSSPSKIARDSLRVLYGFFGLNITERLTRHAELTPYGILAKGADLPAGSHSITIEISDDRKRVSRKTFLFEIKEE